MNIKTYGSLFAGVGGIDLGLDAAGLSCQFQVEWDDQCKQTLAYHWPNVPRWGDIAEVKGYDLPYVDLITFGSPCQDLSIAGRRAGLDGERSGLFHEAVRIIKEMREKSNGQYPKWSIWENVTGALSSNGGADFGQVLWEMDEAGACFSEWAVLDARYFGVPQRRRRIYLLSVFDPAIAGRCPEKILPVAKSGSGHLKKSVKQGQESSDEVASCLRSGGAGGYPSSRGENLIVQNYYNRKISHSEYKEDQVSSTLRTAESKDPADLIVEEQLVDSSRTTSDVSGPLQARDSRGIGNQYVLEHKLIIEHEAIILDGTRVNDVRVYENGIIPSLTHRMGTGGNTVPMVAPQPISNVRRLTPLECERLMGWPDNHTLYRADGKENSDSARYRMCGNGVVSPVIKWIAEKIINI